MAHPTIELRDPLHGPIAVGQGELDVIDARHFQRLRRIKQLGFADLVFPGAVHNRYLHSIGTMHLAGRAFDVLAGSIAWLVPEARARLRQTLRLAALLHDIGHPPLSHAAESLLPDRALLGVPGAPGATGRASHEDMTLKLLLDSALSEALTAAFEDMGILPLHVAALIDESLTVPPAVFTVDGINLRPLLHALVSGELDVDRMDYLLRDSYFAGVSYGRYDLDWLMSNLLALPDETGSGPVMRLAIDLTALPAFEHFLLARYHMFQMVYFHPKSDIYDAMLREWLRGVGDEARFPADTEAYGDCDDSWLVARLRASDDPWARRVLRHDPLGLLVELRDPLDRDTQADWTGALTAEGIEPIWLTARPVLSRYARSPAHLRTDPLLVRDRRPRPGVPQMSRIEEVTDLFDRYERTLRLQRVYVPRDERPRARRIIESRPRP